MTIELISLKPAAEAGQVIACASATATGANAQLWIELIFVPGESDVWDEAYDRVLQLLDIA